MRIVVICLGVFFSISSGAMALPVTFDFASNPNVLQFSLSGLILDVSADSLEGSVSIGGDVTWYSDWGLGVDATGKKDSSKTLDGSGSDDLLTFDFGEKVLLSEVVFTRVGKDDEVRLQVDGVSGFDGFIDGSLTTSSNTVALDFTSLNLVGERFGLLAVDPNDSFRIQSISVDSLEAFAPVPEPSTWLLLCSGLAGLVYWRRRY